MDSKNYEHFYALTKDRSGIILGDEKRYLVDGRLEPIAVAEGLASVDALLGKLHTGHASELLIRRCVDAMATHETSFFRDHTPFDQLDEKLIPMLLAQNAKKRSLRIWSAACSTGQEAYSIAMTLHKHAASFSGWHIEILGTDLTEDILGHARSGRYSAFELHRGLSDAVINQHFKKIDDHTWEIMLHLKSWVSFRKFNLLDEYASLGHFDLVFCRNVLIYFDRAQKSAVLTKLHHAINHDGFLLLGSAETVVGLSTDFTVLKGARGIYQVKNAHAALEH
jgi:chemotaxis protein methyltransferase CheR